MLVTIHWNHPFMARIRSRELHEADELLAEVATWSDADIEALPQLYREKAHAYRALVNPGDG